MVDERENRGVKPDRNSLDRLINPIDLNEQNICYSNKNSTFIDLNSLQLPLADLEKKKDCE